MTRLRIRPIARGIKAVRFFPGTERELQRRADRVAAQARSSAPVLTGAYRASIDTYKENHPTRPAVHVEAQVPYATFVEAKYRTLGMAIDAARG